jgi:hypothetical protein
LNRKIGVALAVLIASVAFASAVYFNQPMQKSSGLEVILASNGRILISDQDVSYYNSTSREFGLTSGCIDRMKGMELYHEAFEVRLDGRLLGNGTFQSNLDSTPPPAGLSIFDVGALQDDYSRSIWMLACYPSGYYSNCTTPSFIGDLAAHFQSLGKLVS